MSDTIRTVIVDKDQESELVNLIAEPDFLQYFNPYQRSCARQVIHPDVRVLSVGLTENNVCKAVIDIEHCAKCTLYYFKKTDFVYDRSRTDQDLYTDFLKALHWNGGGNQSVTFEMFMSFCNRFYV